jgi:hypothetical protein
MQFDLKCSRTKVYAPLSNQIDALSLDVRRALETTFGFEKAFRWERHLAAIMLGSHFWAVLVIGH